MNRLMQWMMAAILICGYDAFYSMLKDLSCYGIAGRENQTDDLSLTNIRAHNKRYAY